MSETGSMPDERPDRIVIQLTPGSRRRNYIKLREYLSFFPKDSIGGANEQSRAPKRLSLHFEGSPETIRTDIAGFT
jgi:hypothetical protein